IPRVEDYLPADGRPGGRQDEGDGLMMRIQQYQQRVIDDAVPPGIHFLNGAASQPQPQATSLRVTPIVVAHLLPVRPEPQQILDFGATDLPSMEKLAASQDRMLVKQLDQPPGKS